jgi:hypothetical protein
MRTHVIVTAVLLAACGTDAVSLDDFDAASRDAYCRHFVKCGLVESVEICDKIGPGVMLGLSVSEHAAIDMGKARYHGDSAATCLDAFADRSCDVTSQSSRELSDACFAEFSGTVHEGQACALDIECISQDCSRPSSCDTACCMGTCIGDTAPGHAKLGESCDHARCESGSFCDAALTCVALKPAGGFCANQSECRYGLDCDRGGTCVALPGPDQPCTSGCRDEGTTCSSTTGTCVKVGLAGAPCATRDDCSRVYHCDATRHCSVGLALGSTCAPSQACAGEGAFCDVPEGELMGTCTLPKDNGVRCRGNPDCETFYCEPGTMVCAPQPVCT